MGFTYHNRQNKEKLYTTLKDLGIKILSKGGIVSELQKVATENEDDAWTTVKRGEDILTPLQIKYLLKNLFPGWI